MAHSFFAANAGVSMYALAERTVLAQGAQGGKSTRGPGSVCSGSPRIA